MGTSDTFARSVAEFADAYTAQNARDFEAFQEALASGRIASSTDDLDVSLVVDEDGNVVINSAT
jgi:hypothetical protein